MLIRENGGRIQTLAADMTPLSAPSPVNAPNLVSRLVLQIKEWTKWYSTLSISNPRADPGMELQFSVKASETRDPLAHLGTPDVGVFDQENITITLKNESSRDLYIYIIDLSSDGSICQVLPEAEDFVPGGGSCGYSRQNQVLQPGMTLSRSFKAFVPPGRTVVTDVLKAFGSSKPVNLSGLIMGGIRGTIGESTALQDLVLEAGGTDTRGLAPIGSNPKPANLGDWTTTQRVLMVRRRK
jgi:hypothetical protein